MPLDQIQIGAQNNVSDGTTAPQRGGRQGDTIVSELHGQFYEANFRGTLFTAGQSSTLLTSTTAIVTGMTASATPIIGLWNPYGSNVNVVISELILNQTVIAATAVAPGGFMWVGSTGNIGVPTLGGYGLNCKTMTSGSPSVTKVFTVTPALTGLTNNLFPIRACAVQGINAPGNGTAVTLPAFGLEQVNGKLIVPPGGVVGVMNQISTTTVSVNTGITWEEVPA